MGARAPAADQLRVSRHGLVTRETEPAVRDDPVTGETHVLREVVYDVDASVLERAQLY